MGFRATKGHTMTERRRILSLILIMTVITVGVVAITTLLLYRAAFEEERARLVETAVSQARLMEAMARHDAIYEQDTPGGPEAATLSQVIDAHERYEGFGETGGFALARLEGDDIVFLIKHRLSDLTVPQPIPLDSDLAEPMQRALEGKSGSVVGLDYRGKIVLAAYEPVAELNLGIVAKIDQAEIRAPFFRAGGIAFGSAIILILLGTVLFIRITNPILRRLREYSMELQQTVDERTRELREAQEQLIRSERLAVLGQLAGGVGHELRNPLAAIKNAAYFLNMVLEVTDPDVKETLGILEKEVDASEKIISSLLDFSRTSLPSRRKVIINDIVREVLSGATVPENVEVTRQLDEMLSPILADPDQLRLVFGNIIFNAIQAMPEGGQLVVTSESPDKEWVAVSFADTGEGIPEENLPKLFEPLFTTKAKGIGLGLAITKTMVEAHGGAIEVRSEVGRGSTFTVKLPVRGEEGKQRGR